MAVGDLIVGPSYPQYEWNGVGGSILFGSGTDWITEKVSGLLGTPEVKTTDLERQGADGDYPGRNYLKSRRIAFDLTIEAESPTERENYISDIDRYFQTSDIIGQLAYMRQGGSKRFLWAVLERSDFDSDYDVAKGVIKGSIQFKCADPVIYSVTETMTTISIPNTLLTSAPTAITNSGTAFNWPRFEIFGPITDPVVANATDGNKQFKYEGAIPSGQRVLVDIRNQTARLWNGASYVDASGNIRADSDWFRLLPGANSITVSRAVGAAQSDTQFYARSSWGGRRS